MEELAEARAEEARAHVNTQLLVLEQNMPTADEISAFAQLIKILPPMPKADSELIDRLYERNVLWAQLRLMKHGRRKSFHTEHLNDEDREIVQQAGFKITPGPHSFGLTISLSD